MFLAIKIKKFKRILSLLILVIVIMFIVGKFINYVLPIKYEDIINKYSKEYGVDKKLILAVINAESRFDKNAKSHKDAVGLMQILPETGVWLAEKMKIEFEDNDLYEPEKNIMIGTFYIKYLLDKYKDERLALCAYNAGSTNVYKWLKDARYSYDGELIHIPFKETKGYVDKINLYKKGYDIILKFI